MAKKNETHSENGKQNALKHVSVNEQVAHSIKADTVHVQQGGAQSVTAQQVNVNQGGIKTLDAVEVTIDQGAAVLVNGQSVVLNDSATIAVNSEVTTLTENSFAGLVIANKVEANKQKTFFLLAGQIEGNVETMFDKQTALIFATTFATVMGLLLFLRDMIKSKN